MGLQGGVPQGVSVIRGSVQLTAMAQMEELRHDAWSPGREDQNVHGQPGLPINLG